MATMQTRLEAKIPGPDTGIEIRKSICAICDPTTQCGLDLYVKDGRIIKTEGSLENAYSHGVLCSKGAATRQYVYSEERLKTPMRRVGPRGSGKFEPISWDEALDSIAGQAECDQEGAWAGERGFLLRIYQVLPPLSEAPGALLRLAELHDGVQHLLHGDGDGAEACLRPARRTGPDEHQLPAGVERQSLPHQSGQGQGHFQGQGTRHEAHRRRSSRDPDGPLCRYSSCAAARHRRRAGSGDGPRDHQREAIRSGVCE